MSERPPAKADPEHIIWTDAYRDPSFLNYVASSLIHFGLTEVFRASVFSRLKDVEAVYAKHDPFYMDDEKHKLLMDLMADHLVDDFRIIVFYENWMKAKLLLEGVCVHTFKAKDDDRTKQLNKVLKQPWAGGNIAAAGIAEEEISKATITMTRLLTKPYQKLIGLPADIYALVKKINKRRNRLHFNTHINFGMGPTVVNEYRTLLDHIAKCQHRFKGQRFGFGPLPLLKKS